MKKQLTTALVIASSITALTAFADKAQRDLMTKSILPRVEAASAKFKEACGCPLAITVDESTVKAKDDLYKFGYMADSIKESAPKYCTDAASKKAMCQLKTLTFVRAEKSGFTFSGGKGVLATDGSSAAEWPQMTKVLDK
jgi:hypothetical protein